jgi:hypothetical protein
MNVRDGGNGSKFAVITHVRSRLHYTPITAIGGFMTEVEG